LKFIDFGTAKDLIQTDLNGPEFVGTRTWVPRFAFLSATGVDRVVVSV
jgi:hypothetical protein